MTTISDLKYIELKERLKEARKTLDECSVLINEMLDPNTEGYDEWNNSFVEKIYSLQDESMTLIRKIDGYFKYPH